MAETEITVQNGLFKPEVMSKELRRNLDAGSVWLDCFNRDYEGEIKYAGDTVKINRPGNITIKKYVKGTPMTYESPKGDQNVLTVDQQDYFAFDIEDIDAVQANIKLVDKYFARSKVAINLAKDVYVATIAWAGIDTKNVLTVDGGLTKDNIYSAFTKLVTRLRWSNVLQNNGKGFDGKNPFVVVDPDVYGLILEAPQATHSTGAGDKTIRQGALMNFAGLDIKVSTNTEETAKHKIIAGTTEGITYADQILKTRTLEDKDDFAAHCSGLYVYGGLVAEPKALAGMEVTLA